jgi:hypothetical protein
MDLRILPAPPGVVPWLPATAMTLTEQWPEDPPVFHAGEPLTRTLTLTAKGLTAAQLPPLGGGSADGFKQYVDQPQLNDVAADDGVTGVREEKIAFLPTQPGRYTLAPIEVSWWDTRTRSVQIVRIPEREVEVLPGSTPQPAAPVAPPVAAAPGARADSPTGPVEPGAIDPRWLGALVVLAFGWLATALGWWWSSRRRRAPPRVEDVEESADLRAARRRLREACARDAAAAAQAALQEWARARWPDAKAGAWRELHARAGTALARELAALDRALYGPQADAWTGEGLWRCFSADAPEREPVRATKPTLAPLHP